MREGRKRSTGNSGRNRGAANLRPFKKGQSGNPRGRPKLPADVKAYLELHGATMTVEALETLRKWARSKSGKLAIAAAANLLRKMLPDTLAVSLSGELFDRPTNTRPFDLSRLTDDQLEQLAYLTSVAEGGSARLTANVTDVDGESDQSDIDGEGAAPS